MDFKTNRKKTRKFLFQELYASCFSKFKEDLFLESFFDNVFDFVMDEEYLAETKKAIFENEYFMIEVIKKYAPKFNIENMNLTYIIPIYIALAEMLYIKEEIPVKVSINEAIELAKVYGDDSSKKIVNGILDKILLDLEDIKTNSENKAKKSEISLFIK